MFLKTFAAVLLAVNAQAEVKYFDTYWQNQSGVRHTNICIGSQDAEGDPVLIDFEADRLARGLRDHTFQLDLHVLDSGYVNDWDSKKCQPDEGETSTVTTLATATAVDDLLRFQTTSMDFDLHEPEITATSTAIFFVLTDITDSPEIISCGKIREWDARSYDRQVDKLEPLP